MRWLLMLSLIRLGGGFIIKQMAGSWALSTIRLAKLVLLRTVCGKSGYGTPHMYHN